MRARVYIYRERGGGTEMGEGKGQWDKLNLHIVAKYLERCFFFSSTMGVIT